MTRVQVLTSIEEMKGLESHWMRLLNESGVSNVFMTWDWQFAWTTHYLGKRQLRLITVYRGQELIGIAPFFIRRLCDGNALSAREFRFLGTEDACPGYLDIVTTLKHRKLVWEEIYKYLHAEGKLDWDLLTLNDMPADSPSVDYLMHLIRSSGRITQVSEVSGCPIVRLTTYEDFLLGLSGNERYKLLRRIRELQKVGRVEHKVFSTSEDAEKWMETFVRLHQMRWEDKGQSGAFKADRFLSFNREVVRRFADHGWLRLEFLLLEGEAIAGIYGFHYGGRYYFYLPGFNPNVMPDLAPGKILLSLSIKEAISKGCGMYDLLLGAADYKIAWANSLERCLTIRHYNRTWRALAVIALESLKICGKVAIR